MVILETVYLHCICSLRQKNYTYTCTQSQRPFRITIFEEEEILFDLLNTGFKLNQAYRLSLKHRRMKENLSACLVPDVILPGRKCTTYLNSM